MPNPTQEQTDSTFSPPKHWMALEELDPKYWNNQAEMEVRDQEFRFKPIETLEKLEKADQGGIARREFLTLMGASMAMATLSCARRPVNKIVPYVVKPENVTPGVANWYASSCGICSSGCGTLVKAREGRPIKLEGNPDHPVNQGKLCAKGQASVLSLYDPDRLRHPLQNSKGSESWSQITWDEADSKTVGALLTARRVRVFSSGISSSVNRRAWNEFLSGFQDGKLVEFETDSLDEIATAQLDSYGKSVVPNYRFDRADVVLSLGADFLGEWVSPVEHAAAWGKRRKLGTDASAKMSKTYCFESTPTITGTNADERFAVRAGDEIKIALSIVNELVGQTAFAGNPSLKHLLSGFDAKKVASEIGGNVSAEKLVEISKVLWAARGRALVVAGGVHARSATALQLQVAVNLLNEILLAEGTLVDGTGSVREKFGSFQDVLKLQKELDSGQVDVLILHGVNPAYALNWSADRWGQAKFVVQVSERTNESSKYADLILAESHSLEAWGDSAPLRNVISIQQPTIAPIGSTRSVLECLLGWTEKLGNSRGLLRNGGDAHGYLKAHWRDRYFSRYGRGRSFDRFWVESLQRGVITSTAPISKRSFRSASLKRLSPYRASAGGLLLSLYSKVGMGDGKQANNGWLQEMPDPISTVTWDNYLNVSPELAKKTGLTQNDVVRLDSHQVSLKVPVNVQPGLHPDSVSLAIGYGRTRVGKVGNNVGQNAFQFSRVSGNHLVLSGHKVTIQKTGVRYELASTQGHHRTQGRPIINDISLREYEKNPAAENHTSPHLRMKVVPTMWPRFKYEDYRWGMAIDLNSCNGCGACVVACQAENNIPIVGRDQIRVGREMHWIRIDRYYSGSQDHPDVLFQPMLCQHCENASCETVCPVLATTHSSEGINEMTYNRCVGTRYCQNNCPYKVRRFNFFDHWKDYQGSQNMVWNPDVTVRSRGVMEKCTFCIQRIQKAKQDVKHQDGYNKDAKLKDGQLKTACQQTCPTDAIVFGNMNDPNSKVSQTMREVRAFRALEAINNEPSISYLTKVRNKDEVSEHVDHHS